LHCFRAPSPPPAPWGGFLLECVPAMARVAARASRRRLVPSRLPSQPARRRRRRGGSRPVRQKAQARGLPDTCNTSPEACGVCQVRRRGLYWQDHPFEGEREREELEPVDDEGRLASRAARLGEGGPERDAAAERLRKAPELHRAVQQDRGGLERVAADIASCLGRAYTGTLYRTGARTRTVTRPPFSST
jgi:hypothetical protein